jgi:dihydrofolate reductase
LSAVPEVVTNRIATTLRPIASIHERFMRSEVAVRPVIVQEFLSLDGVMQAPGDAAEYPGGGWQHQFVGDDHNAIILTQFVDADALLLGRKTYEGFAAVWPTIRDEIGFADRINAMVKYVASSTLNEVSWNATLLRGDVTDAVRSLKEEPGKGVVVVGSRTLVRYLYEHDLVDEYRLWIHPIVVGSGTRLFEQGLTSSRWLLKDVERTEEGVVILTYRRPLK